MTLNPPGAVEVLHTFRRLQLAGKPRPDVVSDLGEVFRSQLGKQDYSAFLGFWHLHLQVIPLDLAKEAWGLTQTH